MGNIYISEGRIGALGNMGTCEKMIWETGNIEESEEGTRVKLVSIQGTLLKIS